MNCPCLFTLLVCLLLSLPINGLENNDSFSPINFSGLRDGQEKVIVTEKIAFKEKVSSSGLPLESDFTDLKTVHDEIKISYTNEYHGFFFKLAPLKGKGLEEEYVLTLNHSLSGVVEIFRRQGQGAWVKLGLNGSEVPYHERLVKGFQLTVPLELSDQEEVSYFLRRKSLHRFDARAWIQRASDYKERQFDLKSYYFFYMGAFLALILYNLFLYFSSKEKNYLYYFIFGLAIHLTVLAMTGFIDYLLAPLGVTGSDRLILFSSSSLMSSLVFAYSYNNLGAYFRPALKIYSGFFLGAAFVFLASIGPWSPYFGGALLGVLIDILIPAGIITMLISGAIALKKGHVLARFYLLSWAFMFGGALVYFSNFAGLVPRNFFTTHAVMWGNLFEMLIVSLGLAYKISTLDREKKEAYIMAKGKKEYERLVRVLLHDIGNPISLIKYYTDLKGRDPEAFEVKKIKAWDKINFGLAKVEEIIKFHRQQELNLKRNFRKLDIEAVNLGDAFNEVKEMFEETLENKNLTLESDVDDSLIVKAEKVSLVNEVLNNIISNAIKFSFKGGLLTVQAYEELGRVFVKIEDKGQGISEQDLKALMDDTGIVSQVGTMGEQGTGYGLYLVKSYMDLYGGQVLVQSIPKEKDPKNHGTLVTLVFYKMD